MAGKMFSYKEAAERLGVALHTLRCWKMEGRLPGVVKLGRLVKFPEAYLQELETKGVPPFDARS
jgi:excisionase family DNA binding protein